MIELTTEEAKKQLARYDNEYYTPQTRQAHRMAIAALDAARWIPVAERLPEAERIEYQEKYSTDEPVEVLVMIEGAEEPTALFYGGIYCGTASFFDFVGDETIYYPVTHWKPMPKPPGKEGNGHG